MQGAGLYGYAEEVRKGPEAGYQMADIVGYTYQLGAANPPIENPTARGIGTGDQVGNSRAKEVAVL
jgi:hypothetical protein